jgi:hypothetical protein
MSEQQRVVLAHELHQLNVLGRVPPAKTTQKVCRARMQVGGTIIRCAVQAYPCP